MITPSLGITATERVLPKLALDFTTGALDSRVTFTRSGDTATVVNSSGYVSPINADLPRFDYDPVTLIRKGLLVEEARTNLMKQSDSFDVGVTWSVSGTSVSADVVTSPANTLTGDKLIASSVSGGHRLIQLLDTGAATNHTFSLYVKKAEYSWFFLGYDEAGTGTQNRQYFNADTIAKGGITGTVVSSSIVDAGNGWVRAQVTFSVTQTTTSYFAIGLATADGTASFTGNGINGIYIWGAQLEAETFATSYIPTTTTAVTRNADVATMTGTNFSDWWQATRGGVLVCARPGTVSGVRPWVQFDDGTANEIIALRGNGTNPELYIVDGGTPQAQIDAGTIAANTDYSLTGWWQTNDCKARLDSGAVVTDTSATIPTVTQARLGSDGTNYLNGHLASISYYNTFSGQIYTRRKNKVIFNLM